MLHFFSQKAGSIQKAETKHELDEDAIWYDLLSPNVEEVQIVEETLGIRIPSLEERQEIEISSRLYSEKGILYMTFNIVANAERDIPLSSPVTFILTTKALVTVRLSDPKPFQTFFKFLQNSKEMFTPDLILVGLLEAITNRIADISETIGIEIDDISREIFQPKSISANNQREFREVLVHLGKKGDLCTKVRESLGSMNRLISFFNKKVSHLLQQEEILSRLTVLSEDIVSVTDFVSFLFNKINFLLDATLGLIDIEQNSIIKIFSVAAVIFLPPTLIASIYGMNFKIMPELTWWVGYPFALILMVISAIFPFFYFKRKGWL